VHDQDDPTLPDNWGHWGPDDELSTFNLATDEVRARAAAEVVVEPRSGAR
jgi:hypothetical protein